jgi:hypothetical protein
LALIDALLDASVYLLRDASRFDHSAGLVISPQLH